LNVAKATVAQVPSFRVLGAMQRQIRTGGPLKIDCKNEDSTLLAKFPFTNL
jgi:hypothetical protein